VEHAHGIMRGLTPKRVVEASKDFTRLLMPRPPEVNRQSAESADPLRQVMLIEFYGGHCYRSSGGTQVILR